jgi:hypothetical protein
LASSGCGLGLGHAIGEAHPQQSNESRTSQDGKALYERVWFMFC